ncbi:MFS transporter [soil metagenome]
MGNKPIGDRPPRKKPVVSRTRQKSAAASTPIVRKRQHVAMDTHAIPATILMAPSIPSIPTQSNRSFTPGESAQSSLFHNPGFLAFWLSRLFGQIAQGAMMYGLLVLVVDSTSSSFYNSIFVVCAILPSIIFGLPAGVAVDALPKRTLLFALSVIRFVFVFALAFQPPALAGIFATALGIWIIHQFYSPAESSTLPALVPAERMTEAQALSNLALVIAQGIGLILLAPLLLKTAGPQYLFAICAALFLTAAFLVIQLPRPRTISRTSQSKLADEGLEQTLLSGARILYRDSILFRVSLVDVIVGIGLSALVVIVPIYLTSILNSSSENTVFVFAPAAIGVIIGLRTAPWMARHIELRVLATAGLVIFASCVAAFGFMSGIYRFMVETLELPLDSLARTLQVAPLALMVMVFSVPAGFSSSVVGVAARTVTLLRSPADSRGKVIATQSLLQNLGALIPTLLAGIAADVIGVERVAIIIAALMIFGATAAFLTRRTTPALTPAPPL